MAIYQRIAEISGSAGKRRIVQLTSAFTKKAEWTKKGREHLVFTPFFYFWLITEMSICYKKLNAWTTASKSKS